MAGSGFDNSVMFASNMDLRQVEPVVGQFTQAGHLMIGTGNVAAPFAIIGHITGGAGVTVTGGVGTIQIGLSGGGLDWTVETGAAVAGVVNHGYITNRAAGVTITLPDTAAMGSILRICGMDGLWVLAQNAGETVYVGNVNTTAGVGGSLTATNAGDCVELVCMVANTSWRVISMVGNITVT